MRLRDAFAVERDVESLALFIGADAKTDRDVDELENDEAHDKAPHQGCDHSAQLQEYAAVRPADLLADQGSGEEGADDSAHAVHAEGVERIIVAERLLERRRGEITEHS